jgi:chromosome segregation ATPase
MLEGILVLVALLGMGVYFVKSADLPKELKERQAILDQESKRNPAQNIRKFNFERQLETKTIAITTKTIKIDTQKIEKEINDLTFKITELEQQIKDNNLKNNEIQSQINSHLIRLEELNKLRIG